MEKISQHIIPQLPYKGRTLTHLRKKKPVACELATLSLLLQVLENISLA